MKYLNGGKIDVVIDINILKAKVKLKYKIELVNS
jgi:hypothetical protein